MTDKRLVDLIVDHGPFRDGQANPFEHVTAAAMNQLRDDLIELRDRRRLDERPPAPNFPEDPEDCEHGVWNPDNRQCLDCGHISPDDLPPATAQNAGGA